MVCVYSGAFLDVCSLVSKQLMNTITRKMEWRREIIFNPKNISSDELNLLSKVTKKVPNNTQKMTVKPADFPRIKINDHRKHVYRQSHWSNLHTNTLAILMGSRTGFVFCSLPSTPSHQLLLNNIASQKTFAGLWSEWFERDEIH